jgi:hypothetical protein
MHTRDSWLATDLEPGVMLGDVPTFIPLTKPQLLPAVGQAIERPVMDWKVKTAAFQFEKAKDVAAFANHLGGTLLIGAHELNGQLQAYVGMTSADAGKLRDDYSKAVADRCQPRPAIDFEEYDDPSDRSKRIVAINVQPSLNLVGVKVNGDKTNEGYGGAAYVFPVRSGTDARNLEPGQLAMFMTPQIRRVVVMLARIPINAEVKFRAPNNKNVMTFVSVNEEENVVLLKSGHIDFVYPLDLVRSVYREANKYWTILAEPQ